MRFLRVLRWLWSLAMTAVGTASLAAVPPSTANCPDLTGAGIRQVQHQGITVAWKPLPHPIPVSQPFDLELVLCGDAVTLVRVDADMPAHRHGMNYRPSITAIEGQRSRVQGMLFHMPGQWRLSFDVQRGPERVRLSDTIRLP